MARDLLTLPCRRRCRWQPTGEVAEGRRVFTCDGCHSEWTAAQPWTPCDADGEVPRAVRQERDAASR